MGEDSPLKLVGKHHILPLRYILNKTQHWPFTNNIVFLLRIGRKRPLAPHRVSIPVFRFTKIATDIKCLGIAIVAHNDNINVVVAMTEESENVVGKLDIEVDKLVFTKVADMKFLWWEVGGDWVCE
jgi:hypothetical protein